MDNIKKIISSHSKEIANFLNEINSKTCTCRNKSNSPLDNKFFYKAKFKQTMASMSYLQKLIFVSTKLNLSPSTTTIQCH